MNTTRIAKFIQILKGKQAFWAGLAPQIFAVLNFVMAAHWLSPDALGTWAMFLTLVSFVETARQGLVQAAVVYFYTGKDNREDRGAVAGASMFIYVVFSLGASLLLFLVALLLQQVWRFEGLRALLAVYTLAGLALGLLRWFDVIQTADQAFGGMLRGALIYGFSYSGMLLTSYGIAGDLSPMHMLLLQVPAAFLTVLLRRRAFVPVLSSLRFSRVWVGEIWRYGRYGLGSNLSSILFQRADVLLLGALATPAGLAAYNIATRIITWLDLPLNAVSQAVFPKIAEAWHHEGAEGITRRSEHSIAVLLGISLPLTVGAFLFAEAAVRFMAGDKYPEAAALLRILLLAGLFKPWGRLTGISLDAAGKPNFNFAMTSLSLVVNLLLLWPLTAHFGIWGAAVASTAGIMLTTIVGRIWFRNLLPLDGRRTVRRVWALYAGWAG